MNRPLAELARDCGGRLVGDGAARVTGVSTDTRTLGPGQLFVAIKGERFDGHAFLTQAGARGAAAALISEPPPAGLRLPVVRVPDTVRALGELAGAHRARFSIPVVAITGSNGKTTTKELCADMLEAAGLRVRRTPGNLNNQIGLPLTLCGLRAGDQALVAELGMNHAGEIDALARLARPTVGAITQIARAHLGPLGSLEAIARAKGELLDRLPEEGTAVLDGDDPLSLAQAPRCRGRVLRFACDAPDAEFRGRALGPRRSLFETPIGSCEVELPLPAPHLARNALCAAAAAFATGRLGDRALAAIRAATLRFRGVPGRLVLTRGAAGIRVLDDSYNANPTSAAAALETLVALREGGRAVAVLGDMLELGETEAELHAELGRTAARLGVDAVVGVGPLASQHLVRAARDAGLSRAHAASDADDAARRVRELCAPGDVVLIKASHGMHLERVAHALREEA
jgi:UDP-N-acetylmuramoyl-tripeptide--D-alanyl-D-alanine ligase